MIGRNTPGGRRGERAAKFDVTTEFPARQAAAGVNAGPISGPDIFCLHPADEYLPGRRRFTGIAVEIEQPQVIAPGALLRGGLGQVRSELSEQLSQRVRFMSGDPAKRTESRNRTLPLL